MLTCLLLLYNDTKIKICYNVCNSWNELNSCALTINKNILRVENQFLALGQNAFLQMTLCT